MPAKVVLKVITGDSVGDEFEFSERTTCILGRHADCYPQITQKSDPRLISRHHCLLDINPPDIRIRDFGSRNGTYVNGQLIGKRYTVERQEGSEQFLPEVDLQDGDEVQIRNTRMRVSIHVPLRCHICGSEHPRTNSDEGLRGTPKYICDDCQRQPETESCDILQIARCTQCGTDVSAEVNHRLGEYVCHNCKTDPFKTVQALLRSADRSTAVGLQPIADYEFLRELGRGGMGAVSLVRHRKTDQCVALKVMLPEIAVDEEITERFLREIETTKALKHPNVVELRESGCNNGVYFFTLEYCDGGSVDGLVKKWSGKVPVEVAIDITLQMLAGLDYAHNVPILCVRLADGAFKDARGLVHRDLKPQNVLLRQDGDRYIAKVSDYGLAKAFDFAGLSGQTRTGSTAGTPRFMPRQQVLNFRYSKPDVDVWAVAATLYFMVTGTFPRDFPEDRDPWQTVLRTSPVPVQERNKSIPDHLAQVIDAALDDRDKLLFRTAAEFRKSLIDAS